MSENLSFALIFKDQSYELPLQFKKTSDISQNIYADLFSNKKYQVQSHVSNEVFQVFYKYLIDGNAPDIFIDNFNELLQLANEFNIKELKDLINAKKSIWRELENKVEKQEQMINQLYNVITVFTERINELTNDFRRYRIESQSNLSEQTQEIKNQLEQLSNQHHSQSSENNQQILERFDSINGQIEVFNTKLSSQNETNMEQMNEIETLRNQFNSVQDTITSQNEKLNQVEESINVKFTENDLRFTELTNQMDEHKNEAQKTFITRDIYINIFFFYQISNKKIFFFI